MSICFTHNTLCFLEHFFAFPAILGFRNPSFDYSVNEQQTMDNFSLLFGNHEMRKKPSMVFCAYSIFLSGQKWFSTSECGRNYLQFIVSSDNFVCSLLSRFNENSSWIKLKMRKNPLLVFSALRISSATTVNVYYRKP